MENDHTGGNMGLQELIKVKEKALESAKANVGHYARMLQGTDERLMAMQGANIPGVDIARTIKVLQEHRAFLHQAWLEASETVSNLEADLWLAKAASAPKNLHQELLRSNWRELQSQIEAEEKLSTSNGNKLANLIALRQSTEHAIWTEECRALTSILLTHEAMDEIKPLLESAFAAALRAGLTESFDHFLITTLAGPDGIRPNLFRIAAAQEQIAGRLGIPV